MAALEQPGQVDARVATHLALHAERAGMPDKAFRYARAAADHAESVGALPEAAAQRHRVAELWAAISEEVRVDHRSEASLWCEAAEAAGRAGWVDAAVTAADAARQVMNADVDPGTAARTLRLWGLFQYTAGRLTAQPLETDRDAVRLSAASEDQEEHALCLAGLSEGETWSGEREAAHEHAEQAVAVARRSGSKKALATALSARSLADNPSAHALLDADEAQALALASGDIDTTAATCVCRANALQELHRFEEAAEQYAQGYARVLERGQRGKAAVLRGVRRLGPHRRQSLRRCTPHASRSACLPLEGNGGALCAGRCGQPRVLHGKHRGGHAAPGPGAELAPDLETMSAQHGPTILALYHIVTAHPSKRSTCSATTSPSTRPASSGTPTGW